MNNWSTLRDNNSSIIKLPTPENLVTKNVRSLVEYNSPDVPTRWYGSLKRNRGPIKMKCPKCDKPMNIQSFRHIEINRCTGCFGIFCSHDTIALVKDVWLAERVLDIGYESTGERFNTVDEILCPECNVQMDKITEAEQTHIWMEECPSCNKLFLDAGELSDLKFNTILDRLRDWKKGTRP